jgi:hypothetical protein
MSRYAFPGYETFIERACVRLKLPTTGEEARDARKQWAFQRSIGHTENHARLGDADNLSKARRFASSLKIAALAGELAIQEVVDSLAPPQPKHDRAPVPIPKPAPATERVTEARKADG